MTDVTDAAVRNVDNGGNVAVKIQQRVQLNCCFGALKGSPGKQGQAQVDGGGIQRIDGLLEVDRERFVSVQGACLTDENLSEVGVNMPVAPLVGVRQSISGNRAAKAHVIKAWSDRTQTSLDIAQTFAVAELGERHTEKLVQTRERLDVEVPTITRYASAQFSVQEQVHQLRKYSAAKVHVRHCGHKPHHRDSNRFCSESPQRYDASRVTAARQKTLGHQCDCTGFSRPPAHVS